MAVAGDRLGIGIRRHFTTEGVDPYDEVEWDRRDSRITDYRDGSVAFEQLGVEVPRSWSMNATNILAQKYFRGTLGTPGRETSLRQVVDRVVGSIARWGQKDGYFVDEVEAAAFADELKHIIVSQKAAFNSPVWFNIGVPGVPQQAAACFILAVDDQMDSILNWYVEEGTIFKGGSGAGTNLSRIRSSKELLAGGGTASGPVSFMRGADASAGTIKSGGKTRRAAKMVILDADHPDVQEFVWCKAKEERKARVLAEAGFDMDLDGADSHSLQYQNANNSVRVTDEFMQAVLDDAEWSLVARTTGEVLERIPARDLFRQIAEAAWECADPGLQYDTTINKWHTAPRTGRINASNPCFPASARVHTDKGLVPFGELFRRVQDGESFSVYTHEATSTDAPAEQVVLSSPEAFMITGFNEIVRLRFDNGMELRCTPSHRLFTVNRGFVEAQSLTPEDDVKVLDLPAPPVQAELGLPVPTDPAPYHMVGDKAGLVRIPEEWTAELAHYLGWVVGDGSVTDSTVVTVYGSPEDREEILPRHAELVQWVNGDRPLKPSEQANGTVQLRVGRRPFRLFVQSLGLKPVRGPEKTVPWAVEQAPAEIAAAFLRGLFDADGCVVANPTTGNYVGLGSTSPQLLRGVQRLLTTFGITSRLYQVHRGSERGHLPYVNAAGETVTYGRSPSYDLRITSKSIARFAAEVGFSLSRKSSLLQEVAFGGSRGACDVRRTARLVERTADGTELTFNLSEPRNHSYIVDGLVVRNCSEYVHLDNSSCNLASINLLEFLEADGSFDVEGFKAAVEVVFTAQEILVGNADYPTDKIGDTTRRFRQLGLGYANLGALLMAEGLPYDSDEGRAWAAAITALMTGHAYTVSAKTAARMGPFAGFHDNAEPMLEVLRMHRAAAAHVDEELVPTALLSAAQEAWDSAVELAELHGVRNSQATVLAPTGTISFLMDCDTTGIEPDLGLVKTKKLVGGGTMSIVNQTIPRALRRLGYGDSQVGEIVAYIDEHKSIVGAPHLRAEHLPVFACSMGDNTIHYTGHVKMMAAAQPFISGAISKCVVGSTLLATTDGLVRIGTLHEGEGPDSYRHAVIGVASVDGVQKTDAFYYGGLRPVRGVVLRSGHRVTGTPNHRLLVAGEAGLEWRRLDELAPGDPVAVQYGAELWSVLPARFDDFVPSPMATGQKRVRIPQEMTEELALFLGAYAAEGHTSRSNWTIVVTNAVDSVLERVAAAAEASFGVRARIRRPADRCPSVELSSKTLVEFLEYLGCGERASSKGIPDAVLGSPRSMILSFLRGLAVGAYVSVSTMPKWAICLDSPALLDDLQAVLTNLGLVNGRISKYNPKYDKSYDEVYLTGSYAKELAALVPFLEPEKAARAAALRASRHANAGTADVVPGVSPAELLRLVPYGRRNGAGVLLRTEFGFLADTRTKAVTRETVRRVGAIEGVVLPLWLRTVLDDGLHFSPVSEVRDAGVAEVYDLSVPETHAFVGNGIMNHNTVNMPEDVSVEDVEQLHVDAWRMGLKAIAIYRDNCKVAQPLSTTKKEPAAAPAPAAVSGDPALLSRIAELEAALQSRGVDAPAATVRRRLPRRRNSKTFAFRVADCEGYVTVGEYEDGHPGEVFMKVSKQGSTLSGVMDAFSISVSLGLQHGVPLSTFVRKYTNMRFEPAGITDDAELRLASSLVDYIFRRLALEYLSFDERMDLGVLSTEERTQPTLPGLEETYLGDAARVEREHFGDGGDALEAPARPRETPSPALASESRDAPFCYACGNVMQRAGSCYACPSCGATSGCS